MSKRIKILVDTAKCNGCRSCELACSFHHFLHFDPSRSSIRVYRNDGDGTIEVSLLSTCDGCPGQEIPFCVRYCDTGCLTFVGTPASTRT